MRAILGWSDGFGHRGEFVLATGETATVGRGVEHPIRSNDSRLSRDHCVLELDPVTGQLSVTDTSSSTTEVNGKPLASHGTRTLARDDVITCASLCIRVVDIAADQRELEQLAAEVDRLREALRVNQGTPDLAAVEELTRERERLHDQLDKRERELRASEQAADRVSARMRDMQREVVELRDSAKAREQASQQLASELKHANAALAELRKLATESAQREARMTEDNSSLWQRLKSTAEEQDRLRRVVEAQESEITQLREGATARESAIAEFRRARSQLQSELAACRAELSRVRDRLEVSEMHGEERERELERLRETLARYVQDGDAAEQITRLQSEGTRLRVEIEKAALDLQALEQMLAAEQQRSEELKQTVASLKTELSQSANRQG